MWERKLPVLAFGQTETRLSASSGAFALGFWLLFLPVPNWFARSAVLFSVQLTGARVPVCVHSASFGEWLHSAPREAAAVVFSGVPLAWGAVSRSSLCRQQVKALSGSLSVCLSVLVVAGERWSDGFCSLVWAPGAFRTCPFLAHGESKGTGDTRTWVVVLPSHCPAGDPDESLSPKAAVASSRDVQKPEGADARPGPHCGIGGLDGLELFLSLSFVFIISG